MHLTYLYHAPQRVPKSGEAKTLLLHKYFYTHTIHTSMLPTEAHHPSHPLQHAIHVSTPSTQAHASMSLTQGCHPRHTL